VIRVAAPAPDETEKSEKPSKLAQLRERHGWFDHVLRAGTRYTERHGDHYAAAITFFSVLSLVPLLMVGFGVAGYVLAFNPALMEELRRGISENLPAGLDTVINPIIEQAVESRASIFSFGLLGALYSGVGWMSNLREALSEQWAQVPKTPALPKRLLFDLLTLIGLGIALIGSFAITGVASGFAATVLDFIGLGDEGWALFLLGVLGFVLGLVANWLIFLWVIAMLPREHATFRSAAKAALLGAIGFEVLKQVMQIYLRTVLESPSGTVFGSLLGLMVFAFFASRLGGDGPGERAGGTGPGARARGDPLRGDGALGPDRRRGGRSARCGPGDGPAGRPPAPGPPPLSG
jgi:membrane protein